VGDEGDDDARHSALPRQQRAPEAEPEEAAEDADVRPRRLGPGVVAADEREEGEAEERPGGQDGPRPGARGRPGMTPRYRRRFRV
jgi:hypothetical protein